MVVHHVQSASDLESHMENAGENLVVLDFFASWCGPCTMISPKVEQLSKEMPDVVFLKVDVDECEDIAQQFNITNMPTFVFIKKTEVVEIFSGANYDKLKNTIQKLK